jgi:hypothetical protein
MRFLCQHPTKVLLDLGDSGFDGDLFPRFPAIADERPGDVEQRLVLEGHQCDFEVRATAHAGGQLLCLRRRRGSGSRLIGIRAQVPGGRARTTTDAAQSAPI